MDDSLDIQPIPEADDLGIQPIPERADANYGNEGQHSLGIPVGGVDLHTGAPAYQGSLANLGGVGEALTTGLIDPMLGAAVGVGGGLKSAVSGGHMPTMEDFQAAQQSYQASPAHALLAPQTQMGQNVQNAMGAPFEALDKYAEGQGPQDIANLLPETMRNDPHIQAAIYAGMKAAPLVAMALGLRHGGEAVTEPKKAGELPATSADKLDALHDQLGKDTLDIQPIPEAAPTGAAPESAAGPQAIPHATEVPSPVAANMEPMENMAAQLAGNEHQLPNAPEEPSPVMSNMAGNLTGETQAKMQGDARAQAAQQILDRRQQELDQQVKTQTTLQGNASLRAKQEAAPTTSPEMQAHIDSVQEAATAAKQAADEAEAAKQKEAVGAQDVADQVAAQKRAEDAQRVLDERQVALDLATKTQQTLDFNAAERARQEAAPLPNMGGATGLNPLGHSQGGAIALGQRGGRFEMNPEQIAAGIFGSHPTDTIKKSEDGLTYTAMREGKPIGKLETNMSAVDNARLGHDPSYPAAVSNVAATLKGKGVGTALYDEMRADHGDNVLPSGQTTPDAWKYWKRNGADKVAQFVDQESTRAAQDPRVIQRISDPEVRRQVAEAAEIKAYTPGEPIQSFNTRTRGQGGAVLIDAGKANDFLKKGIGFFDPRFASFREGTLHGQDLINDIESKGTKDIEGSKLMQTMAGGHFAIESAKGHPLVKYGVDEFRGASDRTQAAQNQLVANGYAKKVRGLNDDEKVAVAGAFAAQEKAGVHYQPEQLQKMGFNPKEIDMLNTHRLMMGDRLNELQASQKEAGMASVHPEAAYVASRAAGDFRKLVFDGDKIVGYIGADTRGGLKAQEAKWKEAHPEYKTGPEQYRGMGPDSGKLATNFHEVFDFLQNSDPAVKAFLDKSKEMRDNELANYRGVNTHTMAKKGILGMPGRDPFKSALQNANDMFQAQVKYMDKVIGYSEFAKAKSRVEPILSHFTESMPNAVDYAQKYADQAMGRSPYAMSRWVSNIFGEINKAVGGGIHFRGNDYAIKNFAGAARSLGNLKMIGGNVISLINQAKDPIQSMPAMAATLRSRGLKAGPTGLKNTFMALSDQLKMSTGAKADPLIEKADAWAKANSVYNSGLFNNSNAISPGALVSAKKAFSTPHNALEKWGRQNAFLASVRALAENGGTPDAGMFYTAKRMTDQMMGSHMQSEKPMVLSSMGGLGKSIYNLGSWKANQLSQMGQFVGEVSRNKSLQPLAAHVLAATAMGGLMAAPLYNESDDIVRALSTALAYVRGTGAPTSLTNELIKHADSAIKLPMTNIPISVKDLMYGIPGQMGLDATKRMGIGSMSPFDLSHGLDLETLAPGAGALTKPVADLAQNIQNPRDEFAWKRTLRDALPSAVQGAFERGEMSTTDKNGREMGLTQQGAKAEEPRNAADKFWKTLGGNGVNESFQKQKLEEQHKQDSTVKALADTYVQQMGEYAANKQDISDLARKYATLTLQNPNSAIQEAYTNGKIPASVRDLIAKKTQAAAMARRFGGR